MRFWAGFHMCAWTVLMVSLGYLLAVFIADVEMVSAPSAVIVTGRDLNRRAPIVRVNGINRGNISGMIGTGARLVIMGKPVIPKPDRTFEMPAAPFLVNIIDVRVPAGAKFVASKRGRKYYPVESTAWRSLKSELLFFRSGKEAEALGYERNL